MNDVHKKNSINLIYTNDFHSQVQYSADFLEMLIKEKKNDSLLIDAGDFYEGTAFYDCFKGKPENVLIKNIYDIIIPGNHGFSEIVKLRSNKKIQVINANILLNGEPYFKPHVIVKKNNLRIGFIGIISTEAFKDIEQKKRKNFSVADPIKSIGLILKRLRSKVDYLILISHSGLDYDKKIADKIRGLDLIIGSHCHSNKYFICNKSNVRIVKARELGCGIGRMSIDKKKIKIKRQLLPDKNKTEFVHSKLKFLNHYIKKCHDSYVEKKFEIGEGFYQRHRNRKSLTKYLAKKIREKYDVDISIINYSCLRDILNPGMVSLEKVYNVLPFNNKIIKFKIEQQEILRIINASDTNIKKFFCVSKRRNNKNIVMVATTSYLFYNVFNNNNKFFGIEVESLRNILIDLFQINDTYGQ